MSFRNQSPGNTGAEKIDMEGTADRPGVIQTVIGRLRGSGKSELQPIDHGFGLHRRPQHDLQGREPKRVRKTSSADIQVSAGTCHFETNQRDEDAAGVEDDKATQKASDQPQKQLKDKITALTTENMRQARELESQHEVNAHPGRDLQKWQAYWGLREQQYKRSIVTLRQSLYDRDKDVQDS